MRSLNQRFNKLKKIVSGYGSCLVAFSGGLDSTFLLKVASEVLARNNLLAVTATSLLFPKEEIYFCNKMARLMDVRHKVISIDELMKDRQFIANTFQRCYICKIRLFKKLKDIARSFNLNFVLDATNLSDKRDFRPGERAKEELGIRSPLQEAGLNKKDIRMLSKRMGLATWNKPPLSCLASRIPYGTKITPDLLRCIDTAERYFKRLGFSQVRFRHHGNLCRIELLREDLERVVKISPRIVKRLRGLGYIYITVDLEGYRVGSMNDALNTYGGKDN